MEQKLSTIIVFCVFVSYFVPAESKCDAKSSPANRPFLHPVKINQNNGLFWVRSLGSQKGDNFTVELHCNYSDKLVNISITLEDWVPVCLPGNGKEVENINCSTKVPLLYSDCDFSHSSHSCMPMECHNSSLNEEPLLYYVSIGGAILFVMVLAIFGLCICTAYLSRTIEKDQKITMSIFEASQGPLSDSEMNANNFKNLETVVRTPEDAARIFSEDLPKAGAKQRRSSYDSENSLYGAINGKDQKFPMSILESSQDPVEDSEEDSHHYETLDIKTPIPEDEGGISSEDFANTDAKQRRSSHESENSLYGAFNDSQDQKFTTSILEPSQGPVEENEEDSNQCRIPEDDGRISSKDFPNTEAKQRRSSHESENSLYGAFNDNQVQEIPIPIPEPSQGPVEESEEDSNHYENLETKVQTPERMDE